MSQDRAVWVKRCRCWEVAESCQGDFRFLFKQTTPTAESFFFFYFINNICQFILKKWSILNNKLFYFFKEEKILNLKRHHPLNLDTTPLLN